MNVLKRFAGLWIALLGLVIVAAWPFVTGSTANREVAFTILRAIALAASLNILLGFTGYVSFGHIVFFGLGGYVGFYFLSQQGWSIWLSILIGGMASGLLAS